MNSFFADMPARFPEWLDGEGPQADIVLATRSRISRNLKTFPFANHASEYELAGILRDLGRTLHRFPLFEKGWLLRLGDLNVLERRALREMLLVGNSLIVKPQERGLALDADLGQAVFINDEDHLKILASRSGFDSTGALSRVMELDDQLAEEIDPAFSEDLGYLTAKPTDVGTGLKLSAVLHLPGLLLAGQIDKILNALRQLQYAVSGLRGKGSAVQGALFQLSNLVSLGKTEEEIDEEFRVTVEKIVNYEISARRHLQVKEPLILGDSTNRSLALLTRCRLISNHEAMELLSSVRLGVAVGLLPPIPVAVLNRAMVQSQNAHLEIMLGRNLAGVDQNSARADFLKKLLTPFV